MNGSCSSPSMNGVVCKSVSYMSCAERGSLFELEGVKLLLRDLASGK